jgi:hypothetical protein
MYAFPYVSTPNPVPNAFAVAFVNAFLSILYRIEPSKMLGHLAALCSISYAFRNFGSISVIIIK